MRGKVYCAHASFTICPWEKRKIAKSCIAFASTIFFSVIHTPHRGICKSVSSPLFSVSNSNESLLLTDGPSSYSQLDLYGKLKGHGEKVTGNLEYGYNNPLEALATK